MYVITTHIELNKPFLLTHLYVGRNYSYLSLVQVMYHPSGDIKGLY